MKERLATLWHRLLCALAIRNEMEWAPPGLGPEVNHPYTPDDQIPWRCCHCGGGEKHAIHRRPFDTRRYAEVLALNRARTTERMKDANHHLGDHVQGASVCDSPQCWCQSAR